jgi:hypothetical protein
MSAQRLNEGVFTPFREYSEHGWHLCQIEAGTKGPEAKGWNTRARRVFDPSPGAGLCHAFSGTCAIDIDELEHARAWLAERRVDLDGLLNAPTAVRIDSGRPNRAKLLFALSDPRRTVKLAKLPDRKHFALELRCAAANGLTLQDVLPPTIHPDTGQPYRWIGDWRALPPLPDAIAELWDAALPKNGRQPPNTQSKGRLADDVLERIRAALDRIDPDCPHDEWIKVGQALHDTGDPHACEIWRTWSERGQKAAHNVGGYDIETKWRSFRAGGGITIGSLFHMAGMTSPASAEHGRTVATAIISGDESGLVAELRHSTDANGTAKVHDEPTADGRQQIIVAQGQLARIVRDTIAALHRARVPLYDRGGQLVRPVRIESAELGAVRRSAGAIVIAAVEADWLRVTMATHIDYRRRSRAAGAEDGAARWTERRVDPPADVARTIARVADLGAWPPLRAVVRHPVLTLDGEWIGEPGYHRGLLIDIAGTWSAPGRSRAGAEAALTLLQHHLRHYPWATAADKSVAIAMLVTAVMRCVLDAAPGIAVDAPAAGTGKSLLVDVAAILATGTRAPVMDFGRDPDEASKRLDGMLLAGDPIIAIDNVEAPLEGSTLCQTLTQPTRRVRPLGASTMVTVPCSALIVATANNVVICGDLVRRMLTCRLDANVERPEQRKFDQDLLAETIAQRRELVAACQTIVAAYLASERIQIGALGSFDEWSRSVRAALVWLGMSDPVDVMERTRTADPRVEALTAVLTSIRRTFGNDTTTVAEMISRAERDAELRDALSMVALRRGVLDANALGHWLRNRRDARVGTLRLERTQGRAHTVRWSVSDGGHGGHGGHVYPSATGNIQAFLARARPRGSETCPPSPPSPPPPRCPRCDGEGCPHCHETGVLGGRA